MRTRACVYLLIGLCGVPLWAQSVAFEVAAVKPNRTEAARKTFPRLQNGTFTAEATSLRTLISIAYGLIEQRIDGPGWIDTEKYDIKAKAPAGVSDSQAGPLLQALLADRFHLKTHTETKELPVYLMTVGKGGSKLKPFDPANPPKNPPNRGQSVLIGFGNSTSEIADRLVRDAGRPVLDKTGIEGRFGWVLEYTPFNNNAAPGSAPDIFVAVEEQLGLKLEPARERLQVLIVESADRVPAEN